MIIINNANQELKKYKLLNLLQLKILIAFSAFLIY
jgi:hypothetical protein